MNKRGITINTALGIIVGAALVFFLFGSSIFKLIFGLYLGQNQNIAVNNFKELGNALNGLKSEGTDFAYLLGHPFYMPNGFVIVGFGKSDEYLIDECQREAVRKPKGKECMDSCLCVYKDETYGDDDFQENTPLECMKIDSDYIFTLDYYGDTNKYGVNGRIYKNILGEKAEIKSEKYKDDYARLFMYGECEDWPVDELIGVQKIYLERVKDGDSVYAFVSDYENGKRYSKRLEKSETK